MFSKICSFVAISLICQILPTYGAVSSQFQFNGELIKFKLAAVNLPNCDFDFQGTSDPYAVLFTSSSSTRQGSEHHHWQIFAKTSSKRDTLNPVWDEVLQFQYINGTDQAWRFLVIDKDDSWYNPFDDPLGRVELRVDDYLEQFRKYRDNRNGTSAQKPIQMFLKNPVGGVLLATPVFD